MSGAPMYLLLMFFYFFEDLGMGAMHVAHLTRLFSS